MDATYWLVITAAMVAVVTWYMCRHSKGRKSKRSETYAFSAPGESDRSELYRPQPVPTRDERKDKVDKPGAVLGADEVAGDDGGAVVVLGADDMTGDYDDGAPTVVLGADVDDHASL